MKSMVTSSAVFAATSINLAVAAFLPALASAQVKLPEAAQTRVEGALETDQLSHGLPHWRTQSLRIAHGSGPRDVREIELLQTRRFGLDDQQVRAVYVTAFSNALTATFAAQVSPTHRILARHGVEGNLQYEFAPAWLVLGGFSRTQYDHDHVLQASLGLEYYFSDFSVAAVWRPGHALGVRTHGFAARAAFYYAQDSSIGVLLSHGQEASVQATAVLGSTVLLSDVRAITLVGRHALTPQWALSYALGRTKQANFYQRTSARVGVQYTF